MSNNLRIGHIYEVLGVVPDGFPIGTRVEFIGGYDNDVFSNGYFWDYLDSDQVRLSEDQSPLEYSHAMSICRTQALNGEDPSFDLMQE